MNHGASKVSSKNMKLLFSSHPQISCFKLLEYSLGKMFSFFFFKLLPFRLQWVLGTKHQESQEVTVPLATASRCMQRVTVQCFFGSGGQRPIHV